MGSIYCGTLKAKSNSKTDIRIVIHDQKINQVAEFGFSIKSQLGGDSTLLNAGKTTNFIYKVEGRLCTEEEINLINEIDTRSKIKDRIEAIKEVGGSLVFFDLQQEVFKNNLVLIDSLLPDILAGIINKFYSSTLSSVRDLTNQISIDNPLNYNTRFLHLFYEYKIKRFLTDVALGMTPSKVWDGLYDATGGYLIVKESGEVLCYHLYNRNKFENYLFANTKLETASSTRNDFGKLYIEKGELFFKLNLQVRFK